MGVCSIDGCGGAVWARGWCGKHYQRWRTHGDPVAPNRRFGPKGDPIERFWRHVDKTETCWLWTSGHNGVGYGQFTVCGTRHYAHRYAYELLVGAPIPDGLTIDHLCKVPSCVNPAHLEPVTMAENLRRSNSMAGVNARKTHCPQGHPYDEENTFRTANGRGCKECNRARSRANYRKSQEAKWQESQESEAS